MSASLGWGCGVVCLRNHIRIYQCFLYISNDIIIRNRYELNNMGSCCQKQSVLSHLDDSVKVMVRHDVKALREKGKQPTGYVPRAPHPLMHPKIEEPSDDPELKLGDAEVKAVETEKNDSNI